MFATLSKVFGVAAIILLAGMVIGTAIGMGLGHAAGDYVTGGMVGAAFGLCLSIGVLVMIVESIHIQ